MFQFSQKLTSLFLNYKNKIYFIRYTGNKRQAHRSHTFPSLQYFPRMVTVSFTVLNLLRLIQQRNNLCITTQDRIFTSVCCKNPYQVGKADMWLETRAPSYLSLAPAKQNKKSFPSPPLPSGFKLAS